MFSRRGRIKFLLFAIISFVSGCSFVDVQDYVHAPTHEVRASVIQSGHTEVDGIGDNNFLLVPNFRTFTSSFSANRAVLIIVSKGTVAVNFDSFTIRNKDTGHIEQFELNRAILTTKAVGSSIYRLGFISLIDNKYENFEKFNRSSELEVMVNYRIGEAAKRTEKFTLKLTVHKANAWIT